MLLGIKDSLVFTAHKYVSAQTCRGHCCSRAAFSSPTTTSEGRTQQRSSSRVKSLCMRASAAQEPPSRLTVLGGWLPEGRKRPQQERDGSSSPGPVSFPQQYLVSKVGLLFQSPHFLTRIRIS